MLGMQKREHRQRACRSRGIDRYGERKSRGRERDSWNSFLAWSGRDLAKWPSSGAGAAGSTGAFASAPRDAPAAGRQRASLEPAEGGGEPADQVSRGGGGGTGGSGTA